MRIHRYNTRTRVIHTMVEAGIHVQLCHLQAKKQGQNCDGMVRRMMIVTPVMLFVGKPGRCFLSFCANFLLTVYRTAFYTSQTPRFCRSKLERSSLSLSFRYLYLSLIMHNSQSSDSGPDVDPATTQQQDQDPVMPPPTSPTNDPIPSPSPPSPQQLQPSTSDQDDPPPPSPQPTQETAVEQRPAEEPIDSRPPPSSSAPASSVTPPPPHPPTTSPPQPPPLPKEESAPVQPPPQPLPAMQYAPRRTQRQRGRPGRPPNINENSLMRRLECVMAVESGRMNMITACQQYDISARTFYRWLRNKDRLIELTGFTEDDFKNGNPPVSKQTLDMQDSARMPVHRQEPDNNLPRLPNQPVVAPPENAPGPVEQSIPPPTTSPVRSYVGTKRRLPKGAEPSQEYAPRPDDRYATYYRRNFTKMPSQPQLARDPGGSPSERQAAARNTTRMRRDAWHEQQNVEYVRGDDRAAYPVHYTEPPQDVYKRRKVGRPAHMQNTEEPSDPIMISPQGEPQTSDDRVEDTPYVNGNAVHHDGPERAHIPSEGSPADGVVHVRNALINGARPRREAVVDEAFYESRIPRKHRIEIMMGRRKVTLAWYDGTSAADIRASIARRFALLPDAQWTLTDHEYDEIVISDGLPSGRYTLSVLS